MIFGSYHRSNTMKSFLLGLFILSAVALTAAEAQAVTITIDGYDCTCVDKTTVSAYKDSARNSKIGEQRVLSGQSSEFFTTECPGCIEVKVEAWGLTSYYYYYFNACKNIRVTLNKNSTCTGCKSSVVEVQ